MKFLPAIILALAMTTSAQSGRVKVEPTPTPKPINGPSVRSVPVPRPVRERVSATPTPTPNRTDDDDVIKVDSALVPIPVSVVDANGRPVTNLKLADFALKIDGVTAEIGELSRSETPIRLAMLFDNSSSVLAAREFEKEAAVRFFRRVLRPDRDLAALFSVSTVTELEQPLTRDVSSLVRSIESFPPPTGATALLEGLVMAAEYLEKADGRRVIVIVSDGDDTKSDVTFEQAMRSIQIANVQVYVVKTTDFENYIRTRSRTGNANIRQLAAERRMQEFTRQTGGAVYSPIDEDELDDAFRQISAELSQQYVLSYYPDDDAAKRGELRMIDLIIKNREDLKVRTRKGYYVPK